MAEDKDDLLIGRFERYDIRRPAHEMDEVRQKTLAYEYLCHLEEAKLWLEALLGETLPPTTELEDNLRNGIYLAKLGHFIAPTILPISKIYDRDQKRYKCAGLQFRHTDNIHQWLKVLKTLDLPITFQPETTDIYDKKNMPRVIYCIHALSTHLFKLGRAPLIQNLYGKVNFTEQEIDFMKNQLQQYGIVMPSFQKIGGLLSSNLNADAAVHHAAIININKTLDMSLDINASLLNPDADLKCVCQCLIEDYTVVLKKAKDDKVQNAQNRSLSESYTPDVYDEFLTHAEIQGYIMYVNYKYAWAELTNCVKSNNTVSFCEILKSDWLNLNHFCAENCDYYFNIVHHLNDQCKTIAEQHELVWPKILQGILNEGNIQANKNKLREKAVVAVNKALEFDEMQGFYRALTDPNLGNDIAIDDYALPLIFEEMRLDKTECAKDLNDDEIFSCIRVLSAVAAISRCIDYGDSDSLWAALNAKDVHAQNIRLHCKERYISALTAARNAKRFDPKVCSVLTYLDVQDCIDVVNIEDEKNEQLIETINGVNQAVSDKNARHLIYCLRKINLNKEVTVSDDNVDLYMRLLAMRAKRKGEMQLLWLEDIESVILQVDIEVKQAKELCKTLTKLNLALLKMDGDGLMRCLVSGGFGFTDEELDQKEMYHQTFQDYFMRKNRKYVCPWVVCHTESGNTLYIDIESCAHSWTTPKDFIPHSQYLSKKDVITILKKISRQHDEKQHKIVLEKTITSLQAHIRGFSIRQEMKQRLLVFESNILSVIRIQSWWRSCVVRNKYKHIIKINTAKRILEKLKSKDPWTWYQLNESKIVRIQAIWRGKSTRKAFLSLLNKKHPSFKVVQKFIPILDFSTEDYNKELELQNLKSTVVQSIRKNQELAKQIEDMDVKIGLLVQNRITLQDVVAHGLKLNSLASTAKLVDANKQEDMLTMSTNRGIKSLTKESRKLLDGYQHLFYFLQTNPIYLSRLLFCLSNGKKNKMLQNVILTMYNFGANARDEYLLLKLFKTSLEEEIKQRITSPFEIVTNTPIILKMAVNHARAGHGPTYLKEIIGPLMSKILQDESMLLETNPVDIFKTWRNQMEMQSGKISSLPFNVTPEQAMAYYEVRLKFESNLELLRRMVTIFLDKITASRNLLPFTVTYMARVLYNSLITKFPRTPEKDVLKVVGHLVYFQFLNCVIVAPDSFDIIKLNHDQTLTNNQRKNLATIAKLLHFSSSKKGFGDESVHLKCLNQFIIDHHESMKDYFRKCCQGPSLEEQYSVNEYTEATLVQQPHIFISIQEIVDTHALVLEHQEVIAPDYRDKIHTLLDDIGSVPSLSELAGKHVAENQGKMDICLTLVDKFNVVSKDSTDMNKMFIKTKELSVSIMPFLQGDHFLQALCIGTTKEQQDQYNMWINQRVYSGAIKSGESMTLREHIALLRKYITVLEDEGFVTREDGYQSIITAIALDLCNKGKYRQEQRRALQTLKKTKQSLDDKTLFYQDQCDYYDCYIKKCLENLNAGKKNVHNSNIKVTKFAHRVRSKLIVKYSALKLYEKGVLIEIDGLSVGQFKNVQFEITPLDHIGIFSIKGRFMGVEVEKIEVSVQELLQMQYDGCAIMDMFGKAKVNVNLLLFLLNSKFYGKT